MDNIQKLIKRIENEITILEIKYTILTMSYKYKNHPSFSKYAKQMLNAILEEFKNKYKS